MTMRRTPFLRIRYPWTDDVVAASNIQAMAQDIDQELVTTATLGSSFSRFATATVTRAAAQSITKATLTAITFDTILLNNGANSPLSNGAWYSATNPTRLTAPVACVVLSWASCGYSLGSALGANGAIETNITLNGAAGSPGLQGTKFNPISSVTGQQWASCLSMWKLAAGDFLELKTRWTGTPAGPINTDTAVPPMLGLAMVALVSLP